MVIGVIYVCSIERVVVSLRLQEIQQAMIHIDIRNGILENFAFVKIFITDTPTAHVNKLKIQKSHSTNPIVLNEVGFTIFILFDSRYPPL